jgi:hypothetical protein
METTAQAQTTQTSSMAPTTKQKTTTGSTTNATTSTTATTLPANNQSTYALFKSASDKMDTLTSCDADFSVDMSVEVPGYSADTTTSGNTKVIMNGSNPTILATKETKWESGFGNGSDDYYYNNGCAYRSLAGQKVKDQMDYDTFVSTTNIPMPISSEADTAQLTEADFKNAKSTATGGTTTITLTLSQARLQELLGSLAKNTASGFGHYDTGNPPVYSNASFIIAIGSNGYVKSTQLKCSITVSTDKPDPNDDTSTVKRNVNMNIYISMTYNNPGQKVTITPPSHLDDYQESSGLGVGL